MKPFSTKREHEMYLEAIEKCRAEIPSQLEAGWMDVNDLYSLEEHDIAVLAYKKAIEGDDLDEMLIEKTFLDMTIMKLSNEMIESKGKVAQNFKVFEDKNKWSN